FCGMRKYVLLALWTVLALSIAAQSQEQKITALLEQHLVEKGKRPVKNILVYVKNQANGFEYHGGVGVIGRNQTKIDEHYQYNIASITKTFVATIILQLYEEGKIDLDRPFTEYIDHYQAQSLTRLHVLAGKDYTDSITTRMLLNHTSGIADVFTDAEFRFNLSVFFRPKRQYTAAKMFRKYYRYGLNKRPHNIPGQGYHYSDIGYMILGFIIEEITGKHLPEVIRHRIIAPISLSNTYFEYYENSTGSGHRIDAYLNRINITKRVNTSYEWAGGGLVATTKDIAQFFQSLFACRLFKDDQTLALMIDMSATEKFGVSYGLGIVKYTFNGITFYGHGGFYGSLTMHSPAKNITLSANIGQANPPYNTTEIIEEILRLASDSSLSPSTNGNN
ncbi:MAG: serine hydrolase domain-containing protein, partial [Bacteroidota bacterium]